MLPLQTTMPRLVTILNSLQANQLADVLNFHDRMEYFAYAKPIAETIASMGKVNSLSEERLDAFLNNCVELTKQAKG